MQSRFQLAVVALLALALFVLAGCSTGTPEAVPTTTGGESPTGAATSIAQAPTTSAVADATAEATSAPGNGAAPTGEPTMSGTPQTLPSTGRKAPEVVYVGTEFAYEGPDSVEAGWTKFVLDNQGEQLHELWVARLLEEKSVEDLFAAFEAEGPPEWIEFYGSTAAEPGARSSVTVNVEPGNYLLLSMGSGGEDQPPDAAQGMFKQITVTEAAGQTGDVQLPQPAATIGLVDFAFVVDQQQLPAGVNVFKLTNTGKELHEVVFQKLKPDATMEDVQAAYAGEMSGTPVPEEELPFEMESGGGFALLSPGKESFTTFDLEAGEYLLICHIPSPANEGRPHFDLGMIRMITVE